MRGIIITLRLCLIITVISVAISSLAGETKLPTPVTEFMAEYDSQFPQAIGVNCWATAMAATGTFPYAGYMDGSQFGFWVSSPLCKTVKPEDPPQAGDILAVKSTHHKKGEAYISEDHAAVFLSETEVYQKTYNGLSDSPQLTTVVEAMEPYGGNLLSDMRLKADEDPLKRTGHWLVYYQCQSLRKYLNVHHGEFMKATAKFWKRFAFEEKDLGYWTMTKRPITASLQATSRRLISRAQFLTQILHLRQRVPSQGDHLLSLYHPEMKPWLEIPEWVVTGLLLRIQSMNQQVQLLINANLPHTPKHQ